MGFKSQLDIPTIAKLKKRVVADAEKAAAQYRSVPRPRPELSSRMLEFAGLIAQGWPNRKIAQHFGVAYKTARGVRSIVYKRLGVSSAAEVKGALARKP